MEVSPGLSKPSGVSLLTAEDHEGVHRTGCLLGCFWLGKHHIEVGSVHYFHHARHLRTVDRIDLIRLYDGRIDIHECVCIGDGGHP